MELTKTLGGGKSSEKQVLQFYVGQGSAHTMKKRKIKGSRENATHLVSVCGQGPLCVPTGAQKPANWGVVK